MIDTGGFYCTDCGQIVKNLPSGRVTCPNCGKLGLRGFNREPRRVACPECDYTGWDDGGVNDDLGRHMRAEHFKAPESEGWAFPTGSRKAHYFKTDGRSLCNRWMWFASQAGLLEPDTGPSRDDCAACRKKLDKRVAS